MRAVVCGAGIAGLALAGCLGRRGWEVVVLERAPRPREQGYMMDFFGPGWDAAEEMGVLPAVLELGYRVERLSYVDDRGRDRAGLPFARFAHALDGHLVSVMRPDLERVLREHARGVAELRYGRRVVGVRRRPGGAGAVLDDGTVLDADLVVGADGVHSAVRRSAFGPEERFRRWLGLHTAAFVVDDPEACRQVGDRFCLTDSVDRAMGFYGLRDGRLAVFAVHRAAAPSLPADPRRACAPSTARWAGSCPASWRPVPAGTGSTTTRWCRSSCRGGAAAGSCCSGTRARRCPCWAARAPRWGSPGRGCSPSGSTAPDRSRRR